MDTGTAKPAGEAGQSALGAEPSLADWTRRLAEGDDAAWGWFHERYYLPLLRYAATRFGNASAASEVVQLAYLRVARHARQFDDAAGFWNWLCCLVRCAAVDHGRHVTRRAILVEKFAHWRAAQSAEEEFARIPPPPMAPPWPRKPSRNSPRTTPRCSAGNITMAPPQTTLPPPWARRPRQSKTAGAAA